MIICHKVGSRYFFEGLEGFDSKDSDYVVFEDNPKLYKFYLQRQTLDKKDIFYWNRAEVLNYNYSKNPMAVGKFLVPEVLEALNLKFEDVQNLIESKINNLKPKHSYQKLIFQFYLKNKKTELSEEQLLEVFNEYKNKKTK